MTDNQADFAVGERYQNRRGVYEVVEVFPPEMQIRYADGEVCVVDMATQRRIISNMARETTSTRPPGRMNTAGRSDGSRANKRVSVPTSTSRPERIEAGHRRVELHRGIRFTEGDVYSRRELHEKFGGQEQGGISTPRDFPIIFLFTGTTGALYGYRDHWDADNVFHYSGEGQVGDMEFIRGNRAIRDHARQGKELHLFQTNGHGDVEYVGHMACVGYDLVANVPDVRGALRTAIVFRLVPEDNG